MPNVIQKQKKKYGQTQGKCGIHDDKILLSKFIGATALSCDRTGGKTCDDPSCTVMNPNYSVKSDIC